jgi:hypothetical protein
VPLLSEQIFEFFLHKICLSVKSEKVFII